MKLFKERNFSIYICGKLVSLLGSNMLQFALSLYVYSVTGSAALFATLISVGILPRFLFSPFAGVFGDWFDRKKMIVRLDILTGLMMFLAAFVFHSQAGFSVAVIFIFILVLETIEIFYEAASSGILPSIVKQDDMADAQSMMSIVLNIGRLLAPMIGAMLYGLFGLLVILLVNGITYLLASFFEALMDVPAHNKKPDKISTESFKKDFKEGLTVIKENTFIRTIIGIGIFINFILSPIFSIGMLVLIIDVLEASEVQYGFFKSTMTVAMIAGPVIVSMHLKKFDIAKVCFMNIFFAAFMLILMGLLFYAPIYNAFNSMLAPFVTLLLLSFMLGIFISIVNITVGTLFHKVVPINLMSRTATAMNLLITIAIPIGQVMFGFLFDTVAPTYVIMSGGFLLLVVIVVARKPLLASTEEKGVTFKKEALASEV